MRNKSILNVDFNIDNEIKRNLISDWIRQNVYAQDLQLSDNPDSDGMFIATSLYVAMNTYATSLTNKLFKWGEIQQYFDCSGSRITNLEGAPEKIKGSFNCSRTKINSLKGMTQNIGKHIDCSKTNIKNLKGAPKIIYGDFDCGYNVELISLEGAPKDIRGNFYCQNCPNLNDSELKNINAKNIIT